MLDNCLLYLSSAMLQVWAAIMVYVILKKRDQLASNRSELYQLWSLAREWWHQPLANLVNPNPPTLRNDLPSFDLSEGIVRTADASLDSFVATILAIKKHQLIVKMGKAFSDTAKIRNVSPQTGQVTLDAIGAKVELLVKNIARLESKDAMGVSFLGIAGNLIILSALPLVTSETAKGVTLFLLMIGNLLLVLSALEEETLFKSKKRVET